MQYLNFLNSKKRKEFLKELEEIYGFSGKLDGELLTNAKGRVYLIEKSKPLEEKADKVLRIDKAGLYIAKVSDGGILMNIEGSQLIGPFSTKNILTLDDGHLEPYVKGEDILLSEEEKAQCSMNGHYLIKHKDDFLGSSIIKDSRIWNCLSKSRRVKNLNI